MHTHHTHDKHAHCCHTNNNHTTAQCHTDKPKPWYKQKLWWVLGGVSILLIMSVLIPGMAEFAHAFGMYTQRIWWAVLLGLVLGGIIDYVVPTSYVMRLLAKKNTKTLLYAAGLGFILSACSHGILALAVQLYKKGASVPAVITFLLAAPWANIAITIMLIGFFGWQALFFIGGALVIAVITGLVYQQLHKLGWIEHNPLDIAAEEYTASIGKDIKRRWSAHSWSKKQLTIDIRAIGRSTVKLTHMVLWWILIGMVAGALIDAFVPTAIMQQYMGVSFLGLLGTLLVATIIEVCSEGSAPIAFEVFRQTGGFGNAFVFLMAGVATDYTEIGLLRTNIGKKTAIWLPIVTVPQVVALGYLLNILL